MRITESGARIMLLAVSVPVEGIIPYTPEGLIEWAGRTCYKSHEKITPGSAGKFIKRVVKSGHHSVLEHSSATFRIEKISRACSHQLVRHRLMAISQESQRYCDEEGIYATDYYVMPKAVADIKDVPLMDIVGKFETSGVMESYSIASWAGKHTVGEWYKEQIKLADRAYAQLQIVLKEAKKQGRTKAKVNEDARYLLPNACCTEIVITANFREFRHIFEVRCEQHAQWEIRAVACEMLRELAIVAPNVFGDLVKRLVLAEDETEVLLSADYGRDL